jgi:hypothetical protein
MIRIGEREKVAKKAVEEESISGSVYRSSLKALFKAERTIFIPDNIKYSLDKTVKESYLIAVLYQEY